MLDQFIPASNGMLLSSRRRPSHGGTACFRAIVTINATHTATGLAHGQLHRSPSSDVDPSVEGFYFPI